MSKDKIKLDFTNVKIKSEERGRGRMKITIKLNKDEALAFNNMKKSLLPEGVDNDVFVKNVFFMGLEQFHNNTMEMMKQYVKENEAKLREDGVDVDSILVPTKIEDNPEKAE